MPRTVSCPVSRIGVPSRRSEANARSSAWAQSIVASFVSSSAGRATLELSRQLGMDREAIGHEAERAVQLAQRRDRHRGLGLADLLLRAAPRSPRSSSRSSSASLAHRRLARREVLLDADDHRLGRLGGDDARLDELRLVQLTDRRMLLDRGVHRRLGVRRLVALVVPVAAVADEVDHHVVAERLAVHHRQARGGQAGLGIVGVDVDDRRVEALGQVGGVVGRATLASVRS